LEEKPESSLVKNVAIAGHVTKGEQQPGTKVDAPSQGQLIDDWLFVSFQERMK